MKNIRIFMAAIMIVALAGKPAFSEDIDYNKRALESAEKVGDALGEYYKQEENNKEKAKREKQYESGEYTVSDQGFSASIKCSDKYVASHTDKDAVTINRCYPGGDVSPAEAKNCKQVVVKYCSSTYLLKNNIILVYPKINCENREVTKQDILRDIKRMKRLGSTEAEVLKHSVLLDIIDTCTGASNKGYEWDYKKPVLEDDCAEVVKESSTNVKRSL